MQSSFVSDCGGGDFAISVAANDQTDLALWDGSEQQLTIVAETPHDEQFEAAFSNGVILYSAVIAPRTTSDLFRWRDGDTTQISSDDVDHAVVEVLSGAR